MSKKKKTEANEQRVITDWKENFEETETMWIGQEGGCEGLRQKGWTAVTIAALKVAEHKTGISSKIIGQGDNQVLSLSLPKKEKIPRPDYIATHANHIETQISEYMTILSDIMKGLGMEIKIQESWISLYHLNYGKELIINGAFTSSILKKISRTYQEVSDAIPTIDNRISSLYSACQTATMKGFDPIIPYYIASVETLQLIDHEYYHGTILKKDFSTAFNDNNIKPSKEFKLFLLVLPKDFGGYQTINYLEFLFRGHPDPLTSQLLWLKQCSKYIDIAKDIQVYICSEKDIKKTVDFQMLVQDPLSINWVVEGSTSNTMKRVLVDSLQSITKNKVIRIMFDTYDDQTLKDLIEYLEKIEPCSPRVLGEIFRLSPEGAKWSFLSTFTDMRTMKDMVTGFEAREMYKKIARSEISKIIKLITVYKHIKSGFYGRYIQLKDVKSKPLDIATKEFQCTTFLADSIREKSWKRKVVGVTTPHPGEQFILSKCIGNECPQDLESNDKIVYSLVKPDRQSHIQDSAVLQRGPNKPYWGSGTSEKKSTPLVQMPKTDRSIKAVQQLSRYRDWVCDDEGTLKELMSSMIKARTELSPQMVSLISGTTYGGSQFHRFSDIMTKKEGRPSIRANLSTCIYFSTDLLGKYAKGLDNYYIFFQGVILLAMTKISIGVFYKQKVFEDRPIAFHQHPRCEGCLQKIEEPLLLVLDTPPLIRSAEGCPLIYSTVTSAGSIADWQSTKNVNLLTPLSPKDYNQRAVCSALSLIIIAEGTSKHSPVVSGMQNIKSEECFVSSITVGLFQKINLEIFFETLAITWLSDILSTALETSKVKGNSLICELDILITSYPESTWALIVPFLALPNVRDQLVDLYADLIHSSEFFKDSRGVGSLMIKIMRQQVSTIFEDNMKLRLPLYFRTNHFQLERSLTMYLNGCILEGYRNSEHDIRSLELRFRHAILRSDDLPVDRMISRMYFEYVDARNKYPGLPKIMPKEFFPISEVGPEPWLVQSPIQKPTSYSRSRIGPKEGDNKLKEIKSVMNEIPVKMKMRLSDDEEGSEEIGSLHYDGLNDEEIPNSEKYSIHYYRICGKYSSAFLKYLQIYALREFDSCKRAIHLAEGSGGVARLSISYLGCEKIYYNSLLSDSGNNNQRLIQGIPAELIDIPPTQCIIEGFDDAVLTGGDYTKPSVITSVKRFIRENKASIELITSDAELPGIMQDNQTMDLIKAFRSISLELRKGTLVVFKTFTWYNDTFLSLMKVFNSFCDNVEVYCPFFSSDYNTEVFVVGNIRDRINRCELGYTQEQQILDLCKDRATMHKTPLCMAKDLVRLYDLVDNIGMSYNVTTAVESMTLGLIKKKGLLSKPLEKIAECKRMAYQKTISRLKGIKHLIDVSEMDLDQRLSLFRTRSDKNAMKRNSEIMFNCDILTQLIMKGKEDDDIWNCNMDVIYSEKVVFRYSPDYQEWFGRYGRYYYKVKGYIDLIKL